MAKTRMKCIVAILPFSAHQHPAWYQFIRPGNHPDPDQDTQQILKEEEYIEGKSPSYKGWAENPEEQACYCIIQNCINLIEVVFLFSLLFLFSLDQETILIPIKTLNKLLKEEADLEVLNIK